MLCPLFRKCRSSLLESHCFSFSARLSLKAQSKSVLLISLCILFFSFPTLSTISNYTFASSFIYLFISAALGLCCCMWAFSSCGKKGLLASCGVRASHCGGLSCCRARALEHMGSVIVAQVLSCSAGHGNFLDPGSNPCPLPWQADSYPQHHTRSPSLPETI